MVGPQLERPADLPHGLVLVPRAGEKEAAGGTAGCRLRYEATVGAALPMIDTFRKLVESGHRVMRVEGRVSGTLGFVLSAIEHGRPFSEAVKEAVAKGYAEPDPREDLSGQVVLRKGLILSRLLGYAGPAPVAENLVPPALRRRSPDRPGLKVRARPGYVR